MAKTRLSILVPVYNEEDLVRPLLDRVLSVDFGESLEVEIVAVDDGSSDASGAILEEVQAAYPGKIVVVKHVRNRGKGAAIRTAIQHASGDFGVIQDSDLEYNPAELPRLLKPLLEGRADAVFGSRFASAGERRVLYFWHSLANHFLTTLCNVVADLNLTDMETGYKAFRLPLVKTIPLRSERFGIEPELTIKLAQRGAALYEVPISYYGRTYSEGKKIGLRDAFGAVWTILSNALRRDVYQDPGAAILDALSQTPRFNRWMADTIRPFVGTRVIEIGAGMGNLTRHLCARRKFYLATDIDHAHLDRMHVRFLNLPQVALAECDLSMPGHFENLQGMADTVICLNVLEHVEDDHKGLRNIASALEAGGRAIVLVPQDQKIYGTLDEVLGHYRRYAESELRKKAEAAGLVVEQVLHFNRITRPGWYLNGSLLHRRHFDRLQLWIFDHLVWLWRRIDPMVPWPAVSIIAIARKPIGDKGERVGWEAARAFDVADEWHR
jgi:2-polyprenyl-3-methyl-5-hydroxy-6-metoxy-1,4-benzoquinol methylase